MQTDPYTSHDRALDHADPGTSSTTPPRELDECYTEALVAALDALGIDLRGDDRGMYPDAMIAEAVEALTDQLPVGSIIWRTFE